MGGDNFLGTLSLLTVLGLLPFLVVCLTAFTKLSIIMFILRNAVGLQQTPPNIVLYSVALILAMFIGTPTIVHAYDAVKVAAPSIHSLEDIERAFSASIGPFVTFLKTNTDPRQIEFFVQATTKVWGTQLAAPRPDDISVLVPSFMASEMTRAFTAGFILYLPFLAIDLVVTSILMAMGMQMVSPAVISVPFKLLLFVLVDGWARLFHGLVLSYGVG